MSYNSHETKKVRVLNVIAEYEAKRKIALAKGLSFKPPSKEQLRKEADVNKNYWSETTDEEILQRVAEITAKKTSVKSKIEEKAEKAVEHNRTLQEMYDDLLLKYDDAQQQIAELRSGSLAKSVAITKLNEIIKKHNISVETRDIGSEKVTPFQTIKGGKDDE